MHVNQIGYPLKKGIPYSFHGVGKFIEKLPDDISLKVAFLFWSKLLLYPPGLVLLPSPYGQYFKIVEFKRI